MTEIQLIFRKIVFCALFLFVALSGAQFLPSLSGPEMRKMLRTEDQAEEAVKCIVNFTPGCNPILEKASGKKNFLDSFKDMTLH